MFRPCDHDSNPSLHLYLYSQMTTFVGLSSGSHVTEALYSMLRMQPPTINSMVGLCVTESLTATSKISLSAGLQLCVVLGMIAAYLIGVGCTACLRSLHVRCSLVAMRTVPLMQSLTSPPPVVAFSCSFCLLVGVGLEVVEEASATVVNECGPHDAGTHRGTSHSKVHPYRRGQGLR